MKTNLVILSVVTCLLAFTSRAVFAADDADVLQHVRNSEKIQNRILTSSQKIVADLDSLVDEYERNGLKGDDFKSLKNLQTLFKKISDKDMAKILASLQDAGANSDPKAALQAMVTAYAQGRSVQSQ